MPELTLVTTCRSRLAWLKESLPTFAAQPDTECVVVDYDCPEKAGDWVQQHYPQVRVIRSGPQIWFHPARSRNLGAAVVRTRWICFVDADVKLRAGFAAAVSERMQPRQLLRASPLPNEAFGTIVCCREDFQRIGGYDEVLEGWGNEDVDLIRRLDFCGCQVGSYPGELLQLLPHDDNLRVQHFPTKDKRLNCTINRVYVACKLDLMHLRRSELPLDQRRRLYQQVRRSIEQAIEKGQPLRIDIPLAKEDMDIFGRLERSLVYTLPELGTYTRAQRPESASG